MSALLHWQMRLVEVTEGPEGDSLPLEYAPARIADYWGRRPVAVTTRILQLLGERVIGMLVPCAGAAGTVTRGF